MRPAGAPAKYRSQEAVITPRTNAISGGTWRNALIHPPAIAWTHRSTSLGVCALANTSWTIQA
jgi:hypothetical protein